MTTINMKVVSSIQAPPIRTDVESVYMPSLFHHRLPLQSKVVFRPTKGEDWGACSSPSRRNLLLNLQNVVCIREVGYKILDRFVLFCFVEYIVVAVQTANPRLPRPSLGVPSIGRLEAIVGMFNTKAVECSGQPLRWWRLGLK